jgi:hypothetical protein
MPLRALPGRLLGLFALLGFGSGQVLAQVPHLLSPSLDISWMRDANLFRSEADPLSDRFRTITVGLKLERAISNQNLTAHLNMSRAEFDRFKFVNYDAKDVAANWGWNFGKLHGNLGGSSQQRLNSFAESHLQERTLQTNRREYFNGVWQMHSNWQWQFGSTINRYDFDSPRQQSLNREVRTNELGFDFLGRDGSRIGLLLVRADAVFPIEELGLSPELKKFNDYRQDDVKLRIEWNLTGKSVVRFEGGKTTREHVIFPVRDYDGLNARLVAIWAPTVKQALTSTVWREIGAVDNLITSYSVNNGLSFDSVWAPNQSLRFDGHVQFETRAFNNIGGAGTTRSDQFRSAQLGLSYVWLRHTRLGLSLSHESLDSNLARHSYRTNGVVANVSYQY